MSDEIHNTQYHDMVPADDTREEWCNAQIHRLDTCGLYCPEPVMLLHGKVREVESGEFIEVMASDPASWRDIPKFCMFLGHELIKKEKDDDEGSYCYLIRKGG